jgi:hypothetical protein
MNKEFIPYEQALALKELGFDEEVEFYKDLSEEIFDMRTPNDAPCILWQQAFRWFREKYQLHSTITSISQESWQWHITKPGESLGKMYQEDFYTYEEAEQDCLVKLIDIIENK